MIASGRACGNCFSITVFQRVKNLPLLSEDLVELVTAVCCFPWHILANVDINMFI